MRIYVADLAAYNNGRLHGVWIDASDDVAAMNEQVNAMLAKSPYPNVVRQIFTCADCGTSRYVTQNLKGNFAAPECDECGDDMTPDWEGAARAQGWNNGPDAVENIPNEEGYWMKAGVVEQAGNYRAYVDAREVCEGEKIEPITFPSAEEYAIHDHEGLGDLGEYAGLGEVAKRFQLAELAEDRGIPLNVLQQWHDDVGQASDDIDDIESALDDAYRGTADNWADFAQDLIEETHDMSTVPEWLQGHIDWESVGRDFEISGDFNGYQDSGTLYVFWAH